MSGSITKVRGRRPARWRRFAGIAAALCLLGLSAIPAQAALPQPDGVAECQALGMADWSQVPDAPAQVIDTAIVDAEGPAPAYCRVHGFILPQVGFELRLPLDRWNGKFLEVGDGGWGGEMYLWFCNGPLRKGYACMASDMGHKGTSSLALWAANNAQAQIDFGFRATHVTAVLGKAMVQRFYARAPEKSMMFGCSTGGYQGLVEAQRFPWDFDGIVAIAPDTDGEADLSMRIVWHMRSLMDPEGHPVFTEPALRLLHQAALAKCDRSDGVADGIVGNPVGCRFDPGTLQCQAGASRECLSAAQVAAGRKVYAGPTTSKGVRISSRGVFPGSEMGWSAEDGRSDVEEFFKYMIGTPPAGPGWRIAAFDFDRDYQRLGLGAVYTDNNPDLRKFRDAGGKLLVAQGGNDAVEIPGAIIDYYETVTRTMGGLAPTQEFFRLFVVPGMKHCTGGDGAFAVDYLSALEGWVDQHEAPTRLIGSHVEDHYLLAKVPDKDKSQAERIWWGALKLTFPLDSDVPTTFSRSHFPYPLVARYRGKGDPNNADSFVAVEPGKVDAR